MVLVPYTQPESAFLDFEQFGRDMLRMMRQAKGSAWWQTPTHSTVYPALNVHRDSEGLLVCAEIPGVQPKDIDIEVTGDRLTIRGERQLPELVAGGSYHRRERDFGRFHRTLTLPERINPDKVVAKFADGVLELQLPYAADAKARKIKL